MLMQEDLYRMTNAMELRKGDRRQRQDADLKGHPDQWLRGACTEKEQLASRQLASEQMADAAGGYAADDVASSSAK